MYDPFDQSTRRTVPSQSKKNTHGFLMKPYDPLEPLPKPFFRKTLTSRGRDVVLEAILRGMEE